MKGLLSSLLEYISDFFSFFSDTALPNIKHYLGIVLEAGLTPSFLGNTSIAQYCPQVVAIIGVVLAITIVKAVLNR